MLDHGPQSKKARVAGEVDFSVFNFEMEMEEEQVPSNSYKSGSSSYFFPTAYQRKPKYPVTSSSPSSKPVTSSAPSSKRQGRQSARDKSGDENQVSISGYNSKQGMLRNKDVVSFSIRNEVIVTASRARLNQHYGRFLTVIFSEKHIEVKQAKEILSRKWQRDDLCVFKSFYKFHTENADEKAIVVLLLHKRRVFGRCSDNECTHPSDVTETLVMEIKNDKWKDQQRKIFELSQGYREVWKRIETEEMPKYKERLTRYPLEELSINANLARKVEPERIPEMSSPSSSWLSPELRTFETLVYPQGDPDAVTITSKDVDVLRPMGFLNDTIIDFYIKYLQNQLSDKDKGRFYFFNSFFFRKLADSSIKYTGPNRGKIVYDRVRKWTRKVSLFEKDYVFIPVNQSLHWSLIIVCHLGNLGSSPDESRGTPCILHLDSMEGNHEGIEEHIRNYILQAWIEEHQSSADEALSHMKYKEATVPQQINHCDCGIYLLHYVELFLKGAPQHFSLASFEGFPYFLTRTWFKSSEASAKRSAIRNLLIRLYQDYHSSATDKQPLQEQVTSSQGTEELLVIDVDDVCISSDSKAIHSDLVASLHRQICEEVEGAGKQAMSSDVGPGVETPLIVDLHSDDEANESSPLEDSQILDSVDGKLLHSSSTSAHEHSSSPLDFKDTPVVLASSDEAVSNDDSVKFSSSADLVVVDRYNSSPSFDSDDDHKNVRGR
ncbi:uncharacterized protein [Physcomitrium patens]|uniref:Ubiquitin-like protease family profile domain-containing protein n=1 Tax=Physcomitrium patens TaxID=3218 RepID=A0A2K1K2P0_PHYPA|nr:hypothetical protein PHYPA_012515 [Physcomitrium patens]